MAYKRAHSTSNKQSWSWSKDQRLYLDVEMKNVVHITDAFPRSLQNADSHTDLDVAARFQFNEFF